jgi:hypothetical protein
MTRAFEVATKRRASRLTRKHLADANRVVDALLWMSPIEAFLLLKEIEILEKEVERLGGKVERR